MIASLRLVCLVSAVAVNVHAQDTTLPARIRVFEQGFDAANQLSGVLLVARGDSVILHHAFGWRDPLRGVRTALDTPIPVASVTKPFTLVAFAQMVTEGKLRLTDTISRWVPELPDAGQITVGHLLNHRAGIRHRVASPADEQSVNSAADVVRAAARHSLVFEPGTRSSYSTAGYGVLARVLEQVDGRPFAELLRARVFSPAGMTSSFDLTGDSVARGFAASFLPRDGRLVAGEPRHLSYLAGGGSSVSTAEDLFRFVRTIRRGGYPGVRFDVLAPSGTLRWTGATGGYFSWVDVLQEDNLTIVWVGNTWGGAAPALRETLVRMIRGESPVPPTIPRQVAGPPASDLAGLTGDYETRPGAFVAVRVDGGLRYDDNYLVPIGRDEYWLPSTSERIRFVRDASGVVSGIERSSGGTVTKMARVTAAP